MDKKGFLIVGGGARGLLFTNIIEKELGRKVCGIVDTYVEGKPYIEQRLEKEDIHDIKLYDRLEDAVREYPADAVAGVFIMTPEWTHADIFEELTKHHYNIFLEKPVVTTEQDAKRLIQIMEGYDKVVQVGFVLRYSLFYRKVKEWIDADRIGQVVMQQLNERLTLQHGAKFKRSWHNKILYTGGYLNEKCSHDLDLMCWFKEKQAQPTHVASYGNRNLCTESIGETECVNCTRENCVYRDVLSSYDKYYNGKVYLDATASGVGKCVYGHPSDIKDNQSAIIVFSDGTHGVFSSITMSGKPGRDICIHGTQGTIYGNLEEGWLRLVRYDNSEPESYELNALNSHGGGDTQIVKEFIDCADTNKPPFSKVRDGIRATQIALACDRSAEQLCFVEVE